MVRVLTILLLATVCGCARRYRLYDSSDAARDLLSALPSDGTELAQCRATRKTRSQCCEDHGDIEGCE
jgi:hypothetical protein